MPAVSIAASASYAERPSGSSGRVASVGLPVEHLPGDRGDREPLEPAVGADEVGRRRRWPGGRAARPGCRTAPAWPPSAQHRDPVAEPDGLVDVVGDEHDRLAHARPAAAGTPPAAGSRTIGSTARERLVHQQHGRVGGQRPGDADPLPLTAGELVRVAVAELRRVQPDQLQQLVDPAADPVLGPAEQPRHGADVRAHRLVREQPDVLDDVADPAAQLHRVDAGDVLAVEQDPAAGRLDQPVDHPQHRRLAAAGRADQHHELAGRHVQAQLARPRRCRRGNAC